MGQTFRQLLSEFFVAGHGVILVILSLVCFIVALGILMTLVRLVMG